MHVPHGDPGVLLGGQCGHTATNHLARLVHDLPPESKAVTRSRCADDQFLGRALFGTVQRISRLGHQFQLAACTPFSRQPANPIGSESVSEYLLAHVCEWLEDPADELAADAEALVSRLD